MICERMTDAVIHNSSVKTRQKLGNYMLYDMTAAKKTTHKYCKCSFSIFNVINLGKIELASFA